MRNLRWVQWLSLLGIAVCLTISLSYIAPLVARWRIVPDFSVVWAAASLAWGDPANAYDNAAMSAAQAWLVPPSKGLRPFPYPPTALMLLAPLGLIPFWAAFWLWVAASAAAFWSATKRLVSGWAVPLSLALPHSVLAIILGQTTLIVASATILSVSLLRSRPVLAGTLMGVAATIKPQALLLAPIALVTGAHWRAIGSAAVTSLLLIAASLALGPKLWLDWLHSFESFPAIVDHYGLTLLGATPRMAGRALGLGDGPLLAVQLTGIALGILFVWCGFRSDDVALRVGTLVGGSLLAAPYAMRYDVAALAPIIAGGLLSGTARGLLIAITAFALSSLAIVPALLISLCTQLSGGRRRAVQ